MEQLTLSFEPGLSKKHQSIRSCVSTCIYRTGFDKVASKLDYAGSNMSRALSDDPGRKFDIEDLERYIEHFHDNTPIWYLIDKFLTKDRSLNIEQLLAKADQLAADFHSTVQLLKQGAGR